MAVLSKIRNNPLLVLIVVGLGTFLFILMDMTSGQNLGGNVAGPTLGTVAGREISTNEFERTKAAVFSGGDDLQNRENLWNFYTGESVVLREADKIGLTVSEAEQEALTFGPNYSRVIQRNWTNQFGQFDPTVLEQYRPIVESQRSMRQAVENRQVNENFIDFWNYQNREILAQRLQEKMSTLVGSALYAPSWLAQERADAQVANRRVAYVHIPFDELANSEVSVSDDDLQAYINEHTAEYTLDEDQVVIDYLVFDVIPTAEDSTEAREAAIDIRNNFATATNDTTFTGRYEGTVEDWKPIDQLSSELSTTFGNEDFATGQIYGPYEEGAAYKLAKLIDRERIPVTADSRHILVATSPQTGGTRTIEQAQSRADSLANLLRRGGSWDELAAEFSDDPGSKDKGGEYEGTLPGQFVPEYDDLIFRTGELGRIYTVETSFGVHVIEVLGRGDYETRVQVAYAMEPILPSSNTDKATRRKARGMLSEHGSSLEELRQAAEAAGMSVQHSEPLGINDFNIANLGADREVRSMVCAAFAANEGEVFGEIYRFDHPQQAYPEKYVLAGLGKTYDAGLAPVDAKRDEVLPIVTNRKKGEVLAGQIGQASSLNSVAQRYQLDVDTLAAVNLTLTSLPALGDEPKFVAAAMQTGLQSVSAPVVGNNGVYVLQPLSDPTTGQSGNLPITRQQMNRTARTTMTSMLLGGLIENAEVVDERATVNCNN